MWTDQQDTIVAVATAPGRGGIGVVRLSGARARVIAEKVSPSLANRLKPRHAHFARFENETGAVIDEGLVLWFPAPHSFTGEEIIELQGHGGPVILDELVRVCVSHGARLAQPGEFSMRAFLNDRMDLAQAEAIADLIDAGTLSSARAALHSLQGAFSKEVDTLIEQLIHLRMYVEAAIDFPEEEIDFLSDGKVTQDVSRLIDQTETVLATARQGALLREGMTLVIAGRPNAGKSSLLNALAGHDAAIVTDIAGTTRDVLREVIQIDGMPLNIIDTAGLRESPDLVEQEGIRRAWQEIEKADRVLVLADAREYDQVQVPDDALPEGEKRLAHLNVPVTLVMNKVDLTNHPTGFVAHKSGETETCFISAKTGAGLDELKAHLKMLAGFQSETESRFSARRRHLVALQSALEKMQHGQDQLASHAAGELLAEDLRAAQQALEEITGAFTPDDLLGRIFSSFCIGK